MPDPILPLDKSARLFLDRLDQLDEVTTRHPVFLTADPDDYDHDGSEPPLRRCCFTTIPNPVVTEDSHKAVIRKLAKKNKELIAALPTTLHPMEFLLPFIPAVWRLLIQLFRPFLTLYFFYKCISYFLVIAASSDSILHDKNITIANFIAGLRSNDPTLWFTIHFAIFSTFLYSVYFDEMLARALWGWNSAVKAGRYYNKDDKLMSYISQTKYFDGKINYEEIRTPYLFTGDTLTAIPFALFAAPEIDYIRRWVSMEDGEAVAIDISFPSRMNSKTNTNELYHDPTKVLHIALFGLNGGSNEAYILDFAHRINALGHTCICMITRGLMGSPIIYGNFFDGSRTTDLERVVKAIHVGLGNGIVRDDKYFPHHFKPSQTQLEEEKTQLKGDKKWNFGNVFVEYNPMHRPSAKFKWNTPITINGWSLGGVILGKYTVRLAEYTGISSAICLAGSSDAKLNIGYENSKKNWQAFLTIAALINILIPQQHLLSPIGDAKRPICMKKISNVRNMVQFDEAFTINYHGYNSIEDYYNNLSISTDSNFSSLDCPMLIIHADDDPVITVDTHLPTVKALEENKIKNLFCMISRGGGHLGYATTMNPFAARWEYPMQCVKHFSEQIIQAEKILQ